MKYIENGHIVICDKCFAHILIENEKEDIYMAFNYNHTKYLPYLRCPCCNNEIYVNGLNNSFCSLIYFFASGRLSNKISFSSGWQ